MTDTALTLMARDYKGLGNQMMTVAAVCLQSTRATDQKSGKLQTASKQGKTEASAKEDKKEH